MKAKIHIKFNDGTAQELITGEVLAAQFYGFNSIHIKEILIKPLHDEAADRQLHETQVQSIHSR